MIQKHCWECGATLIEKPLEGEGIVPFCPVCGEYRFPMYNAAVSMIVVAENTGRILLIQQYGRPSYILVAGYIMRGWMKTACKFDKIDIPRRFVVEIFSV